MLLEVPHRGFWKESDFDKYEKDRMAYRSAINAIHSESVNTFKISIPMNGVLGVKPPSVAVEELELPREFRVIIAG